MVALAFIKKRLDICKDTERKMKRNNTFRRMMDLDDSKLTEEEIELEFKKICRL